MKLADATYHLLHFHIDIKERRAAIKDGPTRLKSQISGRTCPYVSKKVGPNVLLEGNQPLKDYWKNSKQFDNIAHDTILMNDTSESEEEVHNDQKELSKETRVKLVDITKDISPALPLAVQELRQPVPQHLLATNGQPNQVGHDTGEQVFEIALPVVHELLIGQGQPGIQQHQDLNIFGIPVVHLQLQQPPQEQPLEAEPRLDPMVVDMDLDKALEEGLTVNLENPDSGMKRFVKTVMHDPMWSQLSLDDCT